MPSKCLLIYITSLYIIYCIANQIKRLFPRPLALKMINTDEDMINVEPIYCSTD